MVECKSGAGRNAAAALNQRRAETDRVVGRRMTLRRDSLQLTQGEFAQQLGVSVEQLCRYEAGQERLGPALLIQAARILNVNFAWFFDHLSIAESAEKKRREVD